MLVVQILVGFVGYFLLTSVFAFCATMQKVILASRMNAHEGNSINDVAGHWIWDKVPGCQVRQLLVALTLLLECFLMTASYEFEFLEVSAFKETNGCIPATYPEPIVPIDNLGDFLQGDVDPSLIYEYFLPLGDGGVGGFASW